MKNTLETRLGLFFALALLAAFILLEMVGSFDFFKPGLRIRGLFATAHELKRGDPVKLAGVQIGRVEGIDFASNRVEVIMKLDRPDAVRTDSQASIRFSGLLGQNFVDISFGSATGAPLGPNSILTTFEQPDLNTLMARLDGVAGGGEKFAGSFNLDSVLKLLGPLNDFMVQNNTKFAAIVGNMQSISGQIAEGKGTVGKLLYDDSLFVSAQSAVTNLAGISGDIQATLGQARTMITDVGEGKGTIGKLMKDEALYREANVAVTHLREILQKINGGEGTAGKFVNDPSLFKNAKLSLQKLEKATEGLEDQGPLSVIGIVAGALF